MSGRGAEAEGVIAEQRMEERYGFSVDLEWFALKSEGDRRWVLFPPKQDHERGVI